jgi:outer membrane protein TolC
MFRHRPKHDGRNGRSFAQVFALVVLVLAAFPGCETTGFNRHVGPIAPVAPVGSGDFSKAGLISSSSTIDDHASAVGRHQLSGNGQRQRFDSPLIERIKTQRNPDLAGGSDSKSKKVTIVSDASKPTDRAVVRSVAYQSQSSVEKAGSGTKIKADDALFGDDGDQSSGNQSSGNQKDDLGSDSESESRPDADGEDSAARDASDDQDNRFLIKPLDAGGQFGQTFASINNALTLPQVIQSVAQCYPEIEVAIGEIEESRGEVLAKWGDFDSVISAHSISQPLGFYQTYRNGIDVTRPLFGGGEVFGSYRIGDGNFEPWYGERETNEAGEFKAAFDVPLLKNRDIDDRRGNLQAARFKQSQVEANVETRLLLFERFATQAYWDWVAAGRVVVVQRQLLKLAETRVEQISLRIEQGDLAKIAEIDNDRFIAKRKNSLIKARRGLEKSAIKLSIFYRDGNCCPVIAGEDQLPMDFPESDRLPLDVIEQGIGFAIANRPELAELTAARQEALVKLQLANNLLLPKLDVKGSASQDIGGETSSLGDKTPFKLELGVFYEVPIQLRKGNGKIQATQGKIVQIDAKRRFVTDKIRAEIQDAASAVNAAHDQIVQSRENVRLNEQSLELGRLAFEEGDIDLLALNIYESSVADARLQLLEAQFKYFFSLAIYQTKTRSEAFASASR